MQRGESVPVKHADKLVMVWGDTPPIYSVGYEHGAARSDFDSGFTILFDNAPDPDDIVADDDVRISWVHFHHLIEDHPEIGRGLDLARQYGAADLNDAGEWVGRKFPEDG